MTKFCYTKSLIFNSPKINRGMADVFSVRRKVWKNGDTIKISFIGGSEEERKSVKKHASEITKYANLNFVWDVPQQESTARISFVKGLGSYSTVGTDTEFVDKDEETMNFGWDITGKDGKRTIIHEFFHLSGAGHSHSSPNNPIIWDKQAVIDEMTKPPFNWSLSQIQHNIFNQYDHKDVIATEFDPKSIMLYPIPKHWTKNNLEFPTNTELSELDIKHIKSLYPFPNK